MWLIMDGDVATRILKFFHKEALWKRDLKYYESQRNRELVVRFYLLGISEAASIKSQQRDCLNMSWTYTIYNRHANMDGEAQKVSALHKELQAAKES